MSISVYCLDAMSYLDADLIGLWWGNFNLLNHQRLVGLPSHSGLAFDDLGGSDTTLNTYYHAFVETAMLFKSPATEAGLFKSGRQVNIRHRMSHTSR